MSTPAEILMTIPASALFVDPELEARTKIDHEHVSRLARTDPRTWPPLVVVAAPGLYGRATVRYAILDGWHRFLAGQKIELPDGRIGNLETYSCRVIQGAGYDQSFLLNDGRALSLSTGDRKERALFLSENFPDLSHREISRRCGLSRRTVDRLFSQGVSIPTSSSFVSKFIGLLVKASEAGEASGFFGIGSYRAAAIKREVEKSKNPASALKALRIWAKACEGAISAIDNATSVDIHGARDGHPLKMIGMKGGEK